MCEREREKKEERDRKRETGTQAVFGVYRTFALNLRL